jgi:hypothetical protein
MPKNWSAAPLENAVKNGLLSGYENKIMPNDNLTRAQMAAIISRAFGTTQEASLDRFTDVSKKAWYYQDMAKAVQMKIFQGSGDGKLNPKSDITREEAFVVLANALKLSGADKSALDLFLDKESISAWAIDKTASLVGAGYVNGADGKLNPKQNMTRAEFAKLMDNIFQNYITEAGIYEADITGNVMINAANVKLADMTISGDLIIGDGVGDGDITLDNIIVTGRTVIRGGGIHSIIITGNSSFSEITIARVDGELRVFTEEGVEIGELIVDGNDDVMIEGYTGNLTAFASEINIDITRSEIGSFIVAGENLQIIVSEDSSIGTVTVNGNDVNISGDGEIDTVEANADNISILTEGTTVIAAEGTTGITAGSNSVEPGNSKTVSSSSGNSTGGSGGSSSGSNDSNSTLSFASYPEVTFTQTGDVSNSNVQYQNANLVIAALPSEIEVTLENNSTATVPVTWEDTDSYNASAAGSYTFTATWGTLPVGADNDDNLEAPTVEVEVSAGELPTLSFTSYPAVTFTQTGDVANNNVQYQNANLVIAALPPEIEVTLEDHSTTTVSITWEDTDGYSASAAGSYTFTATWGLLPAGTDNDDDLEAPTVEVVVAVGVAATPENYFTFNSITGEITDYDEINGPSDVIIPSAIGGIPVTGLGYGAFAHCTNIISVSIPNSILGMDDYVFAHCSNMTSVTIPDSVTAMGIYTFEGCGNLTSVSLPNRLELIDYGMFYGCTGLTSVDIPESVQSIGGEVFYNCSSLTSITIPDGVPDIGGGLFSGCTNLTSVNIPDSVTIIGASAFNNCTQLSSVSIPAGVTQIGGYAFSHCSSLTGISIPDEVTAIYSGTFSDCSNLSSVSIPEGVTGISFWGFYNCTSLTSITIPDSVTTLGEGVFENCSSLTTVTIGNNVTSIDTKAFINAEATENFIAAYSAGGAGTYTYNSIGSSWIKE